MYSKAQRMRFGNYTVDNYKYELEKRQIQCKFQVTTHGVFFQFGQDDMIMTSK